MADRLMRVHPEDYAYIKGRYAGGELYTKLDSLIFIADENMLNPTCEFCNGAPQWTPEIVTKLKTKQKEINMTHEKKKMTRAEAVELFAKLIVSGDIKYANDMINFYIEAGMLEIVEEKQEENPLISYDPKTQLDAVIYYYDPLRNIHTDQRGKLSSSGGQLLINQLAKLGYKITKIDS